MENKKKQPDWTKTEREAFALTDMCDNMIKQFEAKNEAYGNSFGKQFKKYGAISGLVRLSDKFSRVEALMLGAENKVKDEALEDTLTDLACYALMLRYELQLEREDKKGCCNDI